MKTLNLIGAGRVGKPLAKLWHQQRIVKVQYVLTRSLASATAAVEWIGAGLACEHIEALQPANIIFLAVPDDIIQPICQQLLAHSLVYPETLIFHASGAVAVDCLQPLSPHYAAAHPVLSFAAPDFVLQNFAGTYCTLQGSPTGIHEVGGLFQALGANILNITSLKPTLYHAGLVFLSNYFLSLLKMGTACLHAAGIPTDVAKKMVFPLMQSVLYQTPSETDWHQILTGPISRGDIATITHHLKALSGDLPDALRLYTELGKNTVSLAIQQGLPSDIATQITQLLEDLDEHY